MDRKIGKEAKSKKIIYITIMFSLLAFLCECEDITFRLLRSHVT